MADSTPNFIDAIQEHERSWGMETYQGRPQLSDLLSAAVVAWWLSTDANETRTMASVHEDIDDLNKYASRILLQSRRELPKRRLVEVYVNQKKAVIRGVSLDIVVRE